MFVAAIAAWAFAELDNPMAQVCLQALLAAMLLNALAPHAVLFMKYRRYNPGILTATLLGVPFTILFFRQALIEGFVSPLNLVWLFVLSPFTMLALGLCALAFGALFPAGPEVGTEEEVAGNIGG